MEQRDYMMREIEKIGAMLLALIGKLRTASDAVEFQEEKEQVDRVLADMSGLTTGQVVKLSKGEFLRILESKEAFTDVNMELLSDLLAEIGSGTDGPEGKYFIEKAILILEYLDERSKTYSFERVGKLENLRSLI